MPVHYLGEIAAPGRKCLKAEISEEHMEEAMKCPHLNLWLVAACRIDDTVYVPSSFQLQEYCKKKSHKKCPFFMQKITAENKRGRLVPLHDCV